MQIQIPYGSTQRSIDVPKNATVIRSRETQTIPNEQAVFLAALRQPLASVPLKELVTKQDRIAIVISDITRPTPNERIIPWLLEELSFVPRSQFVILNGTGSHRANTREELI